MTAKTCFALWAQRGSSAGLSLSRLSHVGEATNNPRGRPESTSWKFSKGGRPAEQKILKTQWSCISPNASGEDVAFAVLQHGAQPSRNQQHLKSCCLHIAGSLNRFAVRHATRVAFSWGTELWSLSIVDTKWIERAVHSSVQDKKKYLMCLKASASGVWPSRSPQSVSALNMPQRIMYSNILLRDLSMVLTAMQARSAASPYLPRCQDEEERGAGWLIYARRILEKGEENCAAVVSQVIRVQLPPSPTTLAQSLRNTKLTK